LRGSHLLLGFERDERRPRGTVRAEHDAEHSGAEHSDAEHSDGRRAIDDVVHTGIDRLVHGPPAE